MGWHREDAGIHELATKRTERSQSQPALYLLRGKRSFPRLGRLALLCCQAQLRLRNHARWIGGGRGGGECEWGRGCMWCVGSCLGEEMQVGKEDERGEEKGGRWESLQHRGRKGCGRELGL